MKNEITQCPVSVLFLFGGGIIVLLELSQFPSSPVPPTLSSTVNPHLRLMSMGHLYLFIDYSLLPFLPHTHPPPLWLLSLCSLIPYLWLYFVCLFVLLIKFHLYVRSYVICLSPPGLCHLA